MFILASGALGSSIKMDKAGILKALGELRKQEERKFKQSVDLIINLKNFDVKR